MFKTLSTLFRAQVAEAEEAIFDANASRLLEQRLREANSAFEAGKRDLALVLAEQAGEERAAAAVAARIAELEAQGIAALDAGAEEKAQGLAQRIAIATDEAVAHREAAKECGDTAARLRAMLEGNVRHLAELRRGLATARSADALDRANERSCRAAGLSDSSIREARRTLERIRVRQSRRRDLDEAMQRVESDAALDATGTQSGDSRPRTSAEAVLARLRSQRSSNP